MTTIGESILADRTAAGLTQADVAHLAGVSVATVSLIERGRIDTRVGTLQRIRDAITRASPVRSTGIQPTTKRRGDRRKGEV